ncbi:hypothetical protein H8959_010832, partial [Pygathrix nigripes]
QKGESRPDPDWSKDRSRLETGGELLAKARCGGFTRDTKKRHLPTEQLRSSCSVLLGSSSSGHRKQA